MKKIILLPLLFFFIHISIAQTVDNRLDLHLGVAMGSFSGGEKYTERSFISDAFFANLQSLKGLSLEGTYKLKQIVSAGLSVNYKVASDWQMEGSSIYNGATVTMYSLSPAFLVHTPYRETGALNRLRFLVRVAGVFGKATSRLDDTEIVVIGGSPALTKSTDTYYGWEAGTGFQFRCNNSLGLYARYSYCQSNINCYLYPDRKMTYSQLDAGIFFQAKRVKRY